jgi:hypothetical protein
MQANGVDGEEIRPYNIYCPFYYLKLHYRNFVRFVVLPSSTYWQ